MEEKKKPSGENLGQGGQQTPHEEWALMQPVQMTVTAVADLLWSPSLRQDQGL